MNDKVSAAIRAERPAGAALSSMLSSSDMLDHLLVRDREIRLFARHYLTEMHAPLPMSAGEFWVLAMLARGDARFGLFNLLSRLPITQFSTDRILDALRTESDPGVYGSLCITLEQLPAEDLRRALDDRRITRRMPPAWRADLDEAMEFAVQGFEDLWRIVETCPLDIQQGLFLLEPTYRRSRRLALALARFPEQMIARALAVLRASAEGERARWVRAFAALPLKFVRHEDTLTPLLDLLGEKRPPFMLAPELIEDALVHLGTREVVQAVASRVPRGGQSFGVSAAKVLGRIKRPESERAVLDLLDVTRDKWVRVRLAQALCSLCPTDPAVIDRLHDLALHEQRCPDRDLLEESFLTLCAIQGFEPIEAFAWRARHAAQEDAFNAGGKSLPGESHRDLLELLREEPDPDLN